MRVVLMAAAVAAFIVSTASAQPVYTIDNDEGGRVDQYEHRYNGWSREGAKVVIDGICASACTLVLSTKYNLDICATEKAQLLFHMPFNMNDKFEIMQTRYHKALSVVLWYEKWINQLPRSMAKVLEEHKVPSVYEGAEMNEMIGWQSPGIFKHIKHC